MQAPLALLGTEFVAQIPATILERTAHDFEGDDWQGIIRPRQPVQSLKAMKKNSLLIPCAQGILAGKEKFPCPAPMWQQIL
jgi:hypothetical protein